MYVKLLFPDLCEALRDLVNARVEAREEGFPIPSLAAQNSASRLLHYMYGKLAMRYEVYPTPDGEIAIDAPRGTDHSIVLLCDSDGGAQYFVHLGGLQLFRHCVDACGLPDEFLPIALETMGKEVSRNIDGINLK